MKVLLVGGGAREHALGWKIASSSRVDRLISVPGNPGLENVGDVLADVPPKDPGAVTEAAVALGVDLVVIGPEAPLAAGVADALRAAGVPTFGPDRAAARLESSKSFAKDVMRRAGVPTAESWTFTSRDEAVARLRALPGPFVVKADGLASGKGVLVTGDRDLAESWVDTCLGGRFGAAGETIVIEAHLSGPEISIFAMCDGADALPLAPARDYKRLGDGDEGPNTGGMGSYSPVVDLPDGLVDDTMARVIKPVLSRLAEDGHPYVGFLYAGLVLTDEGPMVLEFNCRLGDPETQVVLPRLEDDLVDVLVACTEGALGSRSLVWSPGAALNVVLATKGYPTIPRTGDPIVGLEEADKDEDVMIFHAGTARRGDELVTAGGRVVSVVGRGTDVAAARSIAYRAAEKITWPGMQWRTDIGR